MKRLTIISLAIGLFLINACTIEGVGPQGPEGPAGPTGSPGEDAFVFEFENINFTAPDYEVFLDYPSDFEGLDSDVALVYFLYGVEEVNDQDMEIWRLLPQTYISDHGILQYNYDFTKNDVRLFLDATYSKDLLTADETDQWIARVVIVPGTFWDASARLDLSDYHSLKQFYNLPDLPTPKLSVNRKLK